MQFNQINTIVDLQEVIDNNKNDDGESISFELKGTDGQEVFSRDQKRLLAKEICAFANTYGGIVCFHYGDDATIKAFPVSFVNEKSNSIETWLRDSLESRISGIDLNIVEGIFLINVPESKNKPHRSAIDNHYYYRHVTGSNKMPEIMISSMYRSQDYLNLELQFRVVRQNSVFHLTPVITNLSNISGTKPMIQVILYAGMNLNLGISYQYTTSEPWGSAVYSSELDEKISDRQIGVYFSGKTFSELVLYPKDHMPAILQSKFNSNINSIDYLLIKFDCAFIESKRVESYFLFQSSHTDKFELITSSKDQDDESIVELFLEKTNDFDSSKPTVKTM